jgi:sulfide dehydrogenase [flavocytochrome c] flavoprotein chain
MRGAGRTTANAKGRRQFLCNAAAAAATAVPWPLPLIAQGAPRIVIIGGGFAGASCARALRNGNAGVGVTLVERQRVYTAPPLCNGVLGGLRTLADQQFGYDRIRAAGIRVVNAGATVVDPHARSVTLGSGDKLSYDRLVIAAGIELRFDAIAGYSEAVAERLPHAWTSDGTQIALLQRQLEAMEDGGLVAITAPVDPARCPPAPYERASMIAYFLKRRKPRSKLVIIDAKDQFTMQALFQEAWKTLYPGLIEWAPPSKGGDIASIDAAKKTINTDFDTYKFAVASVIPPQQAAAIAARAGVADRTGWCPVDPITFESLLQKNIHVIGDAALAGAMPKSAFAAAVEGELCASAIVALIAGKTPAGAKLLSNCYSLLGPDYAISDTGVFRPVAGEYVEVAGAGGVSPLDAPAALRAEEARFADAWFRTDTREIFG